MTQELSKWLAPILGRDEALFLELKQLKDKLGTDIPEALDFASYKPNYGWFLMQPDGIHGVTHETRVMVLSELLSRMYLSNNGDHNDLDTDVIKIASLTHDVRRECDDRRDPEHGYRAARFYLENIARGNGRDHEKVAYLNEWHVPDDSLVPEMILELNIFKDADALDRVRAISPHQRTDPKYLRLDYSRDLVRTSEFFYRITNILVANDFGPYDAVMEAALVLGIVKQPSTSVYVPDVLF
jgi:hypothetical protein